MSKYDQLSDEEAIVAAQLLGCDFEQVAGPYWRYWYRGENSWITFITRSSAARIFLYRYEQQKPHAPEWSAAVSPKKPWNPKI